MVDFLVHGKLGFGLGFVLRLNQVSLFLIDCWFN